MKTRRSPLRSQTSLEPEGQPPQRRQPNELGHQDLTKWREKMVVRNLNHRKSYDDSGFCPQYGTKQNLSEHRIVMRLSHRWLPRKNLSSKVRVRGLPMVQGGHILGCTLVQVKCSSAQWFTTMVYSVFQSLKKRLHLATYGKRKWSKDLVMRISIFYVISMNDYLLERILRTSGNPRRAVEKYAHQMDDEQRFLYGQTCLHVSWLQSRGKIPRVKSITKSFASEYRSFGVQNFCVHKQIMVYLDWLSDPWIVGQLKFLGEDKPAAN